MLILEQSTRSFDIYVNSDKTECMHIKQNRIISTSNAKDPKLVNHFKYLGSNISSTESDLSIYKGKAWTMIEKLSIIRKSGLSDKIKWEFVEVVAVSNTVWLHPMDSNETFPKRLCRNSTRMQNAIPKKSWKQNPTKYQLYGHLLLISQTIRVR